MQNQISVPETLAEKHVEDHGDWMQSDEPENILNPDELEAEAGDIPSMDTENAENNNERNPETDPEGNKEPLTQEEVIEFIQSSQQLGQGGAAQEIEHMHMPELGMVFKTEEEGHKFYNNYAMKVGFSTAIAHKYHSRNKTHMGKVTRVTITCNKAGKPTEEDMEANKEAAQRGEGLGKNKPAKRRVRKTKEGTNDERNVLMRRTNTVVLTACPATMVVAYIDDVWKITRLDLTHNHELHPPGEARFLRSHKNMTLEEKLMIRTCSACKLPTRKIMAILAYMRGGLSSLPYTKKDVSNIRTSIRTESGRSDMMKVLEYFLKKKEKMQLSFTKLTRMKRAEF